MSTPGPSALARRLFESVRRQRPSAELEARILAAGRAELERVAIDGAPLSEKLAPEELERARRTSPRSSEVRRWMTAAALAAAAAVLLVYSGLVDSMLGGTPAEDVLISAERTPPPDPRAPNEPTARSEPTANNETAAGEDALAPPASALARPAPAAPPAPAASPELGAKDRTRPSPSPSTTERPSSTLAPPRASLAQQLDQLKRARAALRAGDHQRALELLDAYRTQPSGGDLAAEASLLRIEALAASGQHDAAARAARQFARDYPNSPLIDRASSFASSFGVSDPER